MDRTQLWYYPLLGLIAKLICLIFGHTFPPDSWYCECCGKHYLETKGRR